MNLYLDTPEKVKIAKMAPTGVAAVNINGTTMNTAWSIPTTKGNDIPKLSDTLRKKQRQMYSELEAVRWNIYGIKYQAISDSLQILWNIWS